MARVTFLIISIACLIIVGVCSGSLKSGRRDVIDGGLGTEFCMLAKNADHDTDDESTMSDERHDLTCSNHWVFCCCHCQYSKQVGWYFF